ncbi:MAG: hypothetical protein LC637_05730 [Xanthomonadaceae bacterium]|nr:hypothetical protein [Xanthomonadaceae bacterium]
MDESHRFFSAEPDAADQQLLEQISAMDPWFYPVDIGGVSVVPGVGSVHSSYELTRRTEYREHLIVDAALERYDFNGKSMLDLGGNISYWPSRFVAHGLTSLTAMEGRPEVVEQARLYWSRNHFLAESNVHLMAGDVLAESGWKTLAGRGPFDCTLCAGLLYHLPEYECLLQRIASLTRDLILVDTRVVLGPEQTAAQKMDRKFNALEHVANKKKPNLIRLMQTLGNLGFRPELILPKQQWPQDMPPQDNYSDGNRVTIIARRENQTAFGT